VSAASASRVPAESARDGDPLRRVPAEVIGKAGIWRTDASGGEIGFPAAPCVLAAGSHAGGARSAVALRLSASERRWEGGWR
jgi:hypothetical protein